MDTLARAFLRFSTRSLEIQIFLQGGLLSPKVFAFSDRACPSALQKPLTIRMLPVSPAMTLTFKGQTKDP